MKNGTVYGKRVRRLYGQLKRRFGSPDIPEATDPVEQMIFARLAAAGGESRAKRSVNCLREVMVDINEVRVSTSMELAAAIRAYIPNSLGCAGLIRRALNDVFRRQHAMTLDVLSALGRREARQYLESLDGVDGYVAASVMLWSLGGHAIPVDSRMFESLRQEDLIDPSATIAEVQAFLERNISASNAKTFCLLMNRHIASKPVRGTAGASKKAARRTAKKGTRTASRTAKEAAGSQPKGRATSKQKAPTVRKRTANR